LGPDKLSDSTLRSEVNSLKGEDSESKPLSFGTSVHRREIIDEFKKLLVEATASLDAECHESVSLRFYFPLPFTVFEFGTVVVSSTWDDSSFSAAMFVAWVCGANICDYNVLIW
jgi:hypothetical protein